jgi:hypothetical protein
MAGMTFPVWFPIYLLAVIGVVLVVRWRAPRLLLPTLAAVVILTFVLALVWSLTP